MRLPNPRAGAALLALALVSAPAAAQSPAPGAPVALPARVVADVFFLRPVTERGDTLELFTDTGGGMMALYPAAAARTGVRVDSAAEGGRAVLRADLPPLRRGASIPLPEGERLVVFPPNPAFEPSLTPLSSGFLGSRFFADRVWTWDYPGGRLLLRAPGDLPRHDARHRVPLFFRADSAGGRPTSFPRLRAEVDGDSLDLLFDTGASTILADSARVLLGHAGPVQRGTSFIAAEVFDRWRQRHPDWRVVERAERGTGAAMIEVPRISVGGYSVGPVWFTRRPDAAFRQYMARFMDRPIDGALGGSALRYFRVTVDYPNAVAVFEKP